ncbi:unnamed protein product [Microthlaspi erraticum]|uniref:Uncharacterized protein n=1 Tax=Microthlaspi erraticum TaxID=1685480 RepID=A0A6D2IT60_9BRAS|nr:unnamed protein product [Microthlaspi erraticum]
MSNTPQWIMIGGEGPESYHQNSSYQRALLEAAKEKMNEAISAKLTLNLITDRFTIVDFGYNIEFQVFFNDFSNNDFNTLFQGLPPERRYYSAGVPGSFLDRVLPKKSFHIGIISYAFHFTSKVPKGITNRNSPLWNKDMHCTGINKAVKKAYLDQYSVDTKNLLDARAEELVPGGLFLIFGSCMRDGVKMSETCKGVPMDCLGASLNDLAQQVHI